MFGGESVLCAEVGAMGNLVFDPYIRGFVVALGGQPRGLMADEADSWAVCVGSWSSNGHKPHVLHESPVGLELSDEVV